eukprot:m.74496 g.74496  ORF g.74496 m.74496 type:complete len:118 (-) comp11802_c0_seq2:737-1090(-)
MHCSFIITIVLYKHTSISLLLLHYYSLELHVVISMGCACACVIAAAITCSACGVTVLLAALFVVVLVEIAHALVSATDTTFPSTDSLCSSDIFCPTDSFHECVSVLHHFVHILCVEL